jgi:hypothetical protein
MPGYRRVPQHIRIAIAECASNTFYIGATRSVRLAEIANGRFSNLGVSIADGQLSFASPTLPSPVAGRWSKWNVLGRWLIRRDLPKVTKTWGWDSPNFGDWSKGSHSVSRTRDVFQRELRHGKRLAFLIDAQESDGERVTLGLRVDRVFDRADLNEVDLLMACSLFRENVGAPSVVASDYSVAAWLADQRVAWEILPVGTGAPPSFADVVQRLGAPRNAARGEVMQTRYDAVKQMKAPAVIVGQGEFSRYFGFKFRDDLVALENLDYGNALYLMYADWEELSQRTRVDLLADPNAHYDRVIHTGDWPARLRHLLLLHGHNPL